jgi:hypothetical protein
MTQQGGCVLPPDGSGRILDRLAGLEKVITPAVVRQVLLATKRVNQRACKLTHEVMLWVVLAMGILTNLPIRQVFKHARRLRMGEDAPHRSSLCVARQRLGARPLRRLFQEVVHPLAKPDTPGGFYRGLRLMGIVVRVIKYTLDDSRRVGHGEAHTLLTNLLDEELYPAAELICGYHERWEQELVFDEQKTHQDPRRATKPAHVRSETPAGVIQELYALSLGHFAVRALMFEAAERKQLDPDRLSFTGCFHILQCRLPECDTRTERSFREWYESLLWELGQERIEPRRNRINPRVIKQKMSKWPKKQPEHCHSPPMTKTSAESVVMLN